MVVSPHTKEAIPMPNSKVRAPEQAELMKIAAAVAPHTGQPLAEVLDLLHCASVAVFPDYCTGSPGYVGPVYVVVWDGGPEIITTLIERRGMLEVLGHGEFHARAGA